MQNIGDISLIATDGIDPIINIWLCWGREFK